MLANHPWREHPARRQVAPSFDCGDYEFRQLALLVFD
jgi:hypothetical protein